MEVDPWANAEIRERVASLLTSLYSESGDIKRLLARVFDLPQSALPSASVEPAIVIARAMDWLSGNGLHDLAPLQETLEQAHPRRREHIAKVLAPATLWRALQHDGVEQDAAALYAAQGPDWEAALFKVALDHADGDHTRSWCQARVPGVTEHTRLPPALRLVVVADGQGLTVTEASFVRLGVRPRFLLGQERQVNDAGGLVDLAGDLLTTLMHERRLVGCTEDVVLLVDLPAGRCGDGLHHHKSARVAQRLRGMW